MAFKSHVTVVLADDHPIWRSGVRADLGDNFRVVAEAGDADEAIAAITDSGQLQEIYDREIASAQDIPTFE